MANTLKFGNGEWYGKKDTILAYNDLNSNYKPLPFDFSRGSSATVVNKDGLIETVGSGQPRIDYKDDSKGALLLEPQSTNLIIQSEYFDGPGWQIFDNIVVEQNHSISPQGLQNASKITSSGGSNDFLYENQSVTSGTTYTTSCFIKNIDSIRTGIYGVSSSDFNIYWDGAEIDYVVGTNVDYEDYGNGWYRVWKTSTATGGSSIMRFYPDRGNAGGGSVLLYGYQVEAKSYPTSYIPTQGGVVTRLGDNITQTTPNLSNSQEVTAFIDLGARPLTGINTTSNNFRIDFGTGNTRIIYNQNSSSNHRIELNINGSATYYTLSNLLTTTRAKIGVSVTPTTLVIYANGVEYHSVSIASTDWSNLLEIETNITDAIGNIKINDFKLYDTALTDQELQALTTI